jgi:hypothetical protein
VCDEKARYFKFTNRKSQEVFDNVIAEDDAQVAIELLVLKARQLGITTKTALKVPASHVVCPAHPGSHGIGGRKEIRTNLAHHGDLHCASSVVADSFSDALTESR